jgi:hypothetical protein
MMTGAWPILGLDHKDLDPSNNRWANLREASPTQNAANRAKPPHNASGYKGVSFKKSRGKFVAYLGLKNAQIYVGIFDTAEEAFAARTKKAAEIYGSFAHHL